MNKTKTYRIEMSLTGRLTQLPDSQRIFGALIYMYVEQYSSEMATALVAKIREKHFFLSLSNMFPRDYLPLPQDLVLEHLDKVLPLQERKPIYREVKKRSFAKLEQIIEVLSDPVAARNLYPYASVISSQQIHASIDSVRFGLPGLDPNVYSVPEINILEAKNNKNLETEVITEFSFYISMEECKESEQLLDALRLAQVNQKRFILGARASQGLNTFVIKNICFEPWQISQMTNRYLNMGMLLPEGIDFQRSSLKLHTSERRPFNMYEGMSRKFISFIDAGSIVYLEKSPREAGCSISSPYRQQDVVFGNAYLLPIPVRSEKEVVT